MLLLLCCVSRMTIRPMTAGNSRTLRAFVTDVRKRTGQNERIKLEKTRRQTVTRTVGTCVVVLD